MFAKMLHIAALLAFSIISGTNAVSQPILVLDETAANVGTVNVGSLVRARFNAFNAGNAALMFVIADPECAAKIILDAQTLEPGETTAISVVERALATGPHTVQVQLGTNDPARAVITLEMTYEAMKAIDAKGDTFNSDEGRSDLVKLSIGHIMGDNASVVAQALVAAVDEVLPSTEIEFLDELSDQHHTGTVRWDERPYLADLVIVYAGFTDMLGEIPRLIAEGRIQALDKIAGFQEIIRPDDIYPNLLEPATAEGHLWAVPVRAGPSCLVVDKSITEECQTWQDLLKILAVEPLSVGTDSDLYLLWRTMAKDSGIDVFPGGRYDCSDPRLKDLFVQLRQLAQRNYDWRDCRVGLANPDVLTDIFGLSSKVRPYPLPVHSSYSSFWCTFYIGVSVNVTGDARTRALEVIAALTSSAIQLQIAKLSFSPPVRPSIAEGAEFRSLFPSVSPVGVLARMVPMIEFRRGGMREMRAEQLFEREFVHALMEPERYEDIVAAAVTQANDILFGKE